MKTRGCGSTGPPEAVVGVGSHAGDTRLRGRSATFLHKLKRFLWSRRYGIQAASDNQEDACSRPEFSPTVNRLAGTKNGHGILPKADCSVYALAIQRRGENGDLCAVTHLSGRIRQRKLQKGLTKNSGGELQSHCQRFWSKIARLAVLNRHVRVACANGARVYQ